MGDKNAEMNLREQGNYYEHKVARHMTELGFKVLQMNYFAAGSEIDVISQKGELIVFTEVKARKISSGLSPYEAVTPVKQRRIINGARQYLLEHNLHKNYIRFDVAGVFTEGGRVVNIEILKDAFQEG
jgi:putative endonuclease